MLSLKPAPPSDRLVNCPVLFAAVEISASAPVSVMPSTSLTMLTYSWSIICQARAGANDCTAGSQGCGCHLAVGSVMLGPDPPVPAPVLLPEPEAGPPEPGPPDPVSPLVGSSPICPV